MSPERAGHAGGGTGGAAGWPAGEDPLPLLRRMRWQVLAIVAAVALVPATIVLAAGTLFARRELDARTRASLQAIVQSRREALELFLEEKLRALHVCATALPVAELGRPEVLERLRQELQRNGGGVVDLGLLDDHGLHVAYAGPYDLRANDYHEEPWFQAALLRGRVLSDVFLGYRRFPHVIAAVKVRDGGRDLVLRATLDGDGIGALVRAPDVEVTVLNREGLYQAEPPADRRLMDRDDRAPLAPHPGVRVGAARRGGRDELVASAWLNGDRWVIVARQPRARTWTILRSVPAAPWLGALLLVGIPAISIVIARARVDLVSRARARALAGLEAAAYRQRMAAIGRLAASVANEIDGPLAGIGLEVEAMSAALAAGEGPPRPAQLQGWVDKVAAHAAHCRKLAHGLRGLSQRVGPGADAIDVQATLDETLALVNQDDASRVRLVRHYAPDVPTIRSGVAQVQQVLLDVLNHALDRVGPEGEVHVHLEPSGLGVEVRVHAQGSAAAPGSARASTPGGPGAAAGRGLDGLGLTVSRQTIGELGGRMDLSAAAGQGTTYRLWLPREPNPG